MINNDGEFFIRTNNGIEGYNNRLRVKIKFLHASVGYVVSKLIDEELYYRTETSNIILRKKGFKKRNKPSNLDELIIKIPLSQYIDDLMIIFKGNKELHHDLNKIVSTPNEDLDTLFKKITIEQSNEISNLILKEFFEGNIISYEE